MDAQLTGTQAQESNKPLSEQAFQAYLLEYEQRVESYRHTYETIWQASALFAALSAGVLAFRDSIPHANLLAPLPVIFWFLGIYRPMNRYGEMRNDRLVEIETLLSAHVPDLEMRHFRTYSKRRKRSRSLRYVVTFEWLWAATRCGSSNRLLHRSHSI